MTDPAYSALPIDALRDSFLRFLSQGMTYAEAYAEFDEEQLRKATIAEIDGGLTTTDAAGEIVTNDSRNLPALLTLCTRANFERRNIRDFEEQAVPLMLAGWTYEIPNPTNRKDFWLQPQTMGFYWRAPSKRPGKPGRLYRSTQQAFNALRKAQES